MALAISDRYRLDVMPNGRLAIEVGNIDAVLILEPKHARKMATEIRSALCGDDVSDLIAERARLDAALAFKRRQWRERALRSSAGTSSAAAIRDVTTGGQ